MGTAMQQLFENDELQKVQEHFCTLTRLFAYCVDEDGRKRTEMSGEKKSLEIIRKAIPEESFYQLFKRISDSALEDMIIEETEYDNIKLAAVLVKGDDCLGTCWLFCCVLNDVTEGNILKVPSPGISTESLYEALDLIADVDKKLLRTRRELDLTAAESRRSRYSESEMSKALKRTEAMTAIVQMLDSNEGFEDAGNEIVKIAGEYLDISGVYLFQIKRDGNHVDRICKWLNDRSLSQMNQTRNLERTELFLGEKPLIVSSDALISAGVRGELVKYRMKAIMSIPIFVGGKPAMYFCVHESEKAKTWSLDDIRFAGDVAKVLQSLLNKRIQKNSLAGSYVSLQEILDNVGTAIYVKDLETGKCLFANKLLKQTFAQELKDGTLDALLLGARSLDAKEDFYEIEHKERSRWYDLYHVRIGWIDKRMVDLYALYDITDKKLYQKRIEQQAYTDFLTGLYNRMCCERDLAAFVDQAKQNRQKGGLLYMDLDDFKHINDGLGHQYGDELLQSVSHAFQKVKGIEETCYRMGGDEFVLIVPPENFDRFDDIVEDVKKIFAKPWYLKDGDYYCTMSMGTCTYPDDGDSVADLIRKADIAMYEAKRTGKNKTAKYSANLSSGSNQRLDMEKNMREAAGENCGEFQVYFQPIVDIQKPGMPCVGAEALVRWDSAALGFVSPSEFIPLAEYLGLITPIGNYVLRKACFACKKWNDNGHPDYRINVNLSVVQLLQGDIIKMIKHALKDSQLKPQNLVLEVTESLAINDMDRMKKILGEIRSLGVGIALDDFGTGYSSLNHIREIPLDIIKVDRSFVMEMEKDEYSQPFIKMVGELASTIGVNLCVEGVETKEQLEILREMDVRLIQGYYFGKPMSGNEFEEIYVR